MKIKTKCAEAMEVAVAAGEKHEMNVPFVQ